MQNHNGITYLCALKIFNRYKKRFTTTGEISRNYNTTQAFRWKRIMKNR